MTTSRLVACPPESEVAGGNIPVGRESRPAGEWRCPPQGITVGLNSETGDRPDCGSHPSRHSRVAVKNPGKPWYLAAGPGCQSIRARNPCRDYDSETG